MTKYKISYYPKAEDELDSIESREALKIVDDIEKFLSLNPFPHKTRKKKIHGVIYSLYRLREVVILRIVKKKEAERAIKSLRK